MPVDSVPENSASGLRIGKKDTRKQEAASKQRGDKKACGQKWKGRRENGGSTHKDGHYTANIVYGRPEQSHSI